MGAEPDWADNVVDELFLGVAKDEGCWVDREEVAAALRKAKADGEPRWRPIETIPCNDPECSFLIYAPLSPQKQVFEARANKCGAFYDPVYDEWSGTGATHWMPLPEPPK